jgi:hypothetical protein
VHDIRARSAQELIHVAGCDFHLKSLGQLLRH